MATDADVIERLVQEKSVLIERSIAREAALRERVAALEALHEPIADTYACRRCGRRGRGE